MTKKELDELFEVYRKAGNEARKAERVYTKTLKPYARDEFLALTIAKAKKWDEYQSVLKTHYAQTELEPLAKNVETARETLRQAELDLNHHQLVLKQARNKALIQEEISKARLEVARTQGEHEEALERLSLLESHLP